MTRIRIFIQTAICFVVLFAGGHQLSAQLATIPEKKVVVPPTSEEIEKLRISVETNFDDAAAHQAYIKAAGVDKDIVVGQYERWMKQMPANANIPFAMGEALAREESPKAKPWLLKAIALNPKFAKAYQNLWIDAERWGDFEGGRKYLGMGAAADPTNADLAFYYANSFKGSDWEKSKMLSLEVAKNFPAHERGAQALYWLAHRSKDPKEKITVWEQLRIQYPPEKSGWSGSGMASYFDFLLQSDPSKALDLAHTMTSLKLNENQTKTWNNQTALAKKIVAANQFITSKKPAEALAILKEVKIPAYSKFNDALAIMKAKAADESGNSQTAYDTLAEYYSKIPTDKVAEELKQLGKKIGKNEGAINDHIISLRNAAAKPATPFTLEQYLQQGTASLADYKGKVVLITYWFPGCGPCRGEFPHFENVVKKFKNDDFVYLALNIVPEQDDYVIPFVKTSGYSFIPLKDVKGREKGNLSNGNAAPVNFLIDKEGNVVFSRFRTDESNEKTLELMIRSLLKKKAI